MYFIAQSTSFILAGPQNTVLLYYTSFSSVLFTSFCPHKNRIVKIDFVILTCVKTSFTQLKSCEL